MVKRGLIYEHYKEFPPPSTHLTLKTAPEGIIIFSLEMREVRLREGKGLAQDHTGRKEMSYALSLSFPIPNCSDRLYQGSPPPPNGYSWWLLFKEGRGSQSEND